MMKLIKKIKSFLFENNHARQTVAKNTIWLSVGTFANRVIKAVIIVYAARILGTKDYGVFSYALSLAALFSVFADIGMSAILTREVAKNPELLEKNLSTSLVVKLFLVGISMILVAFVAPLFSTIKGVEIFMPLAALLIAFDALRDFGFSVTRAKEKMETEAVISLTTGLGITIFGFLALFLRPTAFSLMVGYVAGSGLGFVLAFFLLKKHLRGFWKLFDIDLAKKILKEATPFALMGLLGGITVNTDTIMIGWLRGADAVGIYSAALRIIALIYLIPSLIATSTFPIISKLAKKDDLRVVSILEKTISISLLLAIPIFIGGAVLATPIISFLFGYQYISASLTFAVLLFTIIVAFPSAILVNTIFAYNEHRILVWVMLLSMIGNGVLDYILIKPFGIVGSAFATVLSQSLAYYFIWRKMKKLNNFYTLRHITKGIVAGIIMGMVAYGMNMIGAHVILNIVVSSGIYFLLLALLKEKMLKEVVSILKMREKQTL